MLPTCETMTNHHVCMMNSSAPLPEPLESPRAAAPSPPLSPAAADDNVFEGPEKKLEVFFSLPEAAAEAGGLRAAPETAWAEVCALAACTILHRQSNAHFDAYLLSESSLFVYPHKVVMKTCGTTTLILVLPRLLELADALGAALAHVHYSHYEYKFPHLQLYPHTSYDEEQATLAALLGDRVGAVRARVLGAAGVASGACWYALCTEARALPEAEAEAAAPAPAAPAPVPPAPPTAGKALVVAAEAASGDGAVLEVAMEGLSPAACAVFYGTHPAHDGASGKALARSMSALSGVAALVDGAQIDDWAFEPCGYSMNAQSGPHYYTVHVTPEAAFSYASFETTDLALATPAALHAIIAAFEPSRLTLTLTTRAAAAPSDDVVAAAALMPALELDGFVAAARDHTPLSSDVAVACRTFLRQPAPGELAPPAALAVAAALAVQRAEACARGGGDDVADDAFCGDDVLSLTADSASTAPLDEVGGAIAGESAGESSDSEAEGAPKRARPSCDDGEVKHTAALDPAA